MPSGCARPTWSGTRWVGGSHSNWPLAAGPSRSSASARPAGGCAGSAEERRIIRFFTRTKRLIRVFGPLLPFVARHSVLRRIALRDVLDDGAKMPAEEALALFEGARQCTIFDDVLGMTITDTGFAPGLIDCPVRILYGSADRILRWPTCFPVMREVLSTVSGWPSRAWATSPCGTRRRRWPTAS